MPMAQAHHVEFFVISMASGDDTLAWIDYHNINIPIFVGDETTILKSYQVPGTPYYYHINNDNEVTVGGTFDDRWVELTRNWE